MTTVKVRNNAIAYAKGVDAAGKSMFGRIPKCPYGETKLIMKSWWYAGLNDKRLNNYDEILYQAGKGKREPTYEEQEE